MKNYPTLSFIEKYGTLLSAAAGLAPILGGIYLIRAFDLSPLPTLVILFTASLILFILVKSFSELVAIVLDMLVPR